ncbi:MAG TPA: HAMP domain-containing sensor histidine kinase [Candidatus Saccharimonadales bacterium]|nr:HAMP domain-containing sensor histidine kinase [Candidatus Saccharimonadales bacterium]
MLTLDKSFQVQSWNHWMEVHSAMRFENIAGKSIFALFPTLQDRKLVAPFERALNGETSVLSTALHRYLLPLPSPIRRSGAAQMLQTAQIAPLLLGSVVCGIVVVIEDVTQRESQAEALRRQHRRDKILSWALTHLWKSDEPRKIIRQLFFKIAEHLDFDTFLLYLRDIETGTLALYTAGGIPPELAKEFADYPLLASVAQSREMVVIDSIQARQQPEYAPLKKAGASAAIAIPLFANERPLGLLCFASWSRESIATEESDLLTTIAQYLATAVDRENTNRQLQRAREELQSHAQLLEKKVEERTARLQETISELETFSYTLAHDLKAPLRGMIGYCQILLEDFGGILPPEAHNIVERLARTPRRMEALIKDLLQFSDISRQEIVLSRVEIEPVIDDILALRAPGVRQATTIRTPLQPVRAHLTLLQQVLANLVDNAIKFVHPKTQAKITIFTEVVSHSSPSTRSQPLLFNSTETAPPGSSDSPLEITPKGVRIWVVDEGIGIPIEAHQKIFGIFERGAFAERYEGTGMGLAIVARATQRMGGTCGVESKPGHGSRFWIELPAA